VIPTVKSVDNQVYVVHAKIIILIFQEVAYNVILHIVINVTKLINVPIVKKDGIHITICVNQFVHNIVFTVIDQDFVEIVMIKALKLMVYVFPVMSIIALTVIKLIIV
jgi:hypothetical protein